MLSTEGNGCPALADEQAGIPRMGTRGDVTAMGLVAKRSGRLEDSQCH